jgi:hypothetical protein
MGVRITMFTHIGISEAAQVADLRCTFLRPSYSQQVWPSHPCEQNQQTSGLHSLEHSEKKKSPARLGEAAENHFSFCLRRLGYTGRVYEKGGVW